MKAQSTEVLPSPMMASRKDARPEDLAAGHNHYMLST